jgi:biopolymer transport protein TolR
MSMGGAGGKGVKSDINVTPLVDVCLVLLIIFMVITPMLQRGKAVNLPQAKHIFEPKAGGDPILLSVTKDKKLYVDKTEVRREALADALKAEMQRMPGAPVVLKGDKDVDYKTVREVVLEISKCNVQRMSLAANAIKEKK